MIVMNVAADQMGSSRSSGMTLRKSTRILRKSVPALPVKTTGIKKAMSAAAAAGDQSSKGSSQEVKGAGKEGVRERQAEESRLTGTWEEQKEAKAGGMSISGAEWQLLFVVEVQQFV